MGYKIIFLDGLDGRPFVECQVCKELNRNVIEPVVIFVKEEDFEEINHKIKILPKDIVNAFIDTLIKKTNNLLKRTEKTCIFHCQKENEIWIKNFEMYLNYLKKEKLKNEKTFEEKLEDLFTPNQILWNDFLVNEFWKRIRTYRFCIDYWKKEDTQENLQFIENNEEIKDLLKFYREKIQNEPDKYDFRGVIFPMFQEEYIGIKKNKRIKEFKQMESLSFWYKNENKEFKKNVIFSGTQFFGEADFCEVQFSGRTDFFEVQFSGIADFRRAQFSGETHFSGTQFFGEADFCEVQFSGRTDFFEVQFPGKADFTGAQFEGEANFSKAQFSNGANFSYAQFSNGANFSYAQFSGGANFWIVQFSGKADFTQAQFKNRNYFFFKGVNKQIDFSSIQVTPEAHIEIRNLKTKRIVLNDFTNYAKDFIFFNLELLESEEDKPSLEIKNSILNKMRFVNCYFSDIDNEESKPKIEIENSYLASCEFANVFWGDITEERICHSLIRSNDKKNILKARDIFRQLKAAYDNHKDFIQGSEFYALEMRTYDKYLDSLSWLEYFRDKLVFKISKLTSNYAQDWWLVLKWIVTIILMLTFFSLLDYFYVLAKALNIFQEYFLMYIKNFVYFTPMIFILYWIIKFLFYFLLEKNLFKTFKKLNINLFLFIPMILFMFDLFLLNFNLMLEKGKNLFKTILNLEAIDLYLQILAKTVTPWKNLLNETSSVHSVLYKIIFTFSVIAISYLAYQLIVSLRRKIRR